MPTLTIQPSDIDNWLASATPNSNYGTVSYLDVCGFSTARRRTLLQFNFSSLPDGATISAATLSLYYYYKGGTPEGNPIYCYEVTQTGWTETGSTWNKYDGINNWATPGGDYTTERGVFLEVPTSFGWMDWDILELAQHFQSDHNKIANLILIDFVNATDTTRYYSNNYTGDPSLRPKLVIEYTIGIGDTGAFFQLF